MLEIKDLFVETLDHKEILKGFSLAMKPGEIHVIMGPNGTGKSTLSKVILRNPDYVVKKGDILYQGESILPLSTDEVARRGIFLAMQNPISIEGVSNSEFLRTALNARSQNKVNIYLFMKEMEQAFQDLAMPKEMMHRSINQDFSGGERKKNEILQMKLLKPQLILLDELDSGLDIDSLKIVCQNINDYLIEHEEASLLIITHYPRILDYLHPDVVHIMIDGRVVKSGDISLAYELEKNGYHGMNVVSEEEIHE